MELFGHEYLLYPLVPSIWHFSRARGKCVKSVYLCMCGVGLASGRGNELSRWKWRYTVTCKLLDVIGGIEVVGILRRVDSL